MPFGRGGRPGLIGMAARTAVVAGTATAVSGNVSRRQQARAQGQADQQAASDQQAWEAQQYEAQQQAAAAPPPRLPQPHLPPASTSSPNCRSSRRSRIRAS